MLKGVKGGKKEEVEKVEKVEEEYNIVKGVNVIYSK